MHGQSTDQVKPSINDYHIRQVTGTHGERWWKASRLGWSAAAPTRANLDGPISEDFLERYHAWKEAQA